MENNQTAVDWVIDQLRMLAHNSKTHLGMGDIRITQGYIDGIEEQAKAMEKEQIMEAVYEGMCTNFDANLGRAEQYYEETYGTR